MTTWHRPPNADTGLRVARPDPATDMILILDETGVVIRTTIAALDELCGAWNDNHFDELLGLPEPS